MLQNMFCNMNFIVLNSIKLEIIYPNTTSYPSGHPTDGGGVVVVVFFVTKHLYITCRLTWTGWSRKYWDNKTVSQTFYT